MPHRTLPDALRSRINLRLHLQVLGLPLLVLALLCGLSIGSLQMLGSVRAYVGGESLWSKGRASAVQHLLDYSQSGQPADLERFRQALGVPEGDHRARLAMSQHPIDMDAAREGFLAGGLHPADITGMIWLFRLFGDQWIFKDSLQAWIQGDILLDDLRLNAERLRRQTEQAAADTERNETLLRIQAINRDLLVQEKRFITSLNTAARLTELILHVALLATAVLLSGLYVFLARRALKMHEQDAQALRQASERWELAAASAGLGRFDLDVENERYTLDPQAAELHGLGRQPRQLSREEARTGIHPDDQVASKAVIDEAIRTGGITAMRYRVTLPSGEVRYIENTGRLDPRSLKGRPHITGVIRDVTEQVMQAQAAVQRDAAERVAVSQRAFLSRLSHELRTPLNAILGFAQLLDMDRSASLSGTQHQQVQWILGAGRQLLSLVEDVMDLSKVEAGEVTMRPQSLTVQQALRECLPLIEVMRASQNVRLVDQLPPEPVWVHADPQRLQQVFINLLSNGCKYNRPGGMLSYAARVDGAEVVVDISDTGIGMSQDEAAELFQPFKRLSGPAAQVEGTGLGLYIVRQLVQRMDGGVSVRSAPGQGACFTVRLPAAAPPAAH